ncbi:hypothetical protein BGZ70_005112 [Mortierella alpina]|uniref:Peptidase M13 N-terminal domain-containing protein n=1 Tax=Mortierella alpina TaxID=64518 RepID=A0A9P6M6D8_MORAP|nr:hypothetical protein BGZ70_005112 [Mortierella alpina]
MPGLVQSKHLIRTIVDFDGFHTRGETADDVASPFNLKKPRDFYSSCMDKDQIVKRGHHPLLTEIRNTLRMFYVSDGDFERYQDKARRPRITNSKLMSCASAVDRHALSMTLAYFNKLGLEAVLSLGTFVDVKNPQKWILKLDNGGVGMPSFDLYFKDDGKAAYIKWISNMFNLIVRNANDDTSGSTESP